ncbi:YbjN domain-containing protein [Corynebacterium sp. AOP40-9SA-29]|uniref:YbjN domain-containing protein n=1 Tax=Corynebacterium sp. AOP40-9SA-29 TaxID=3457677 RepID=UPI004034D585
MSHVNDTTDSADITARSRTNFPDVVLRQISRHRVMDALERLEFGYSVDNSAEISSKWDHGRFYFNLAGSADDILSVSGYWSDYLPPEYRADLLEFCNDWNSGHYMPSAAVTEDEDGDIYVAVEHAVHYRFGAADDQISQHILSAISGGCILFASLAERFGDGVEDIDY